MESKAMADQIVTVSKERLTERQGILLAQEMDGVDMAIGIQPGIAV
jgi:mRNA-degrading endonuclease toxin of MazEF toxin-antitoxin module